MPAGRAWRLAGSGEAHAESSFLIGDARILFGKAITRAEKKESRGRLPLIHCRREKTAEVTLELMPCGACIQPSHVHG